MSDARVTAGHGTEASTAPGRVELVGLEHVSVQFRYRPGSFSLRKAAVTAVDDVSLSVGRGVNTGIVGETGSGKSTIAQLLLGMVEPTSGTIRVDGHDVAELSPKARASRRRRIQMVLQDPFSSLNPRMRVADIIGEPLTLGRPARGVKREQVRARVEELMEMVGLRRSWADRYPVQFSGGQCQRIAIARALAPDPTLIVLDEPTSALDVSVQAQILNLLVDIQTELGVTYLIISHDLMTVAFLAPRVAVMRQGRFVEVGETEALFEHPRHRYTLELLASVPVESGSFMHRAAQRSGAEDGA